MHCRIAWGRTAHALFPATARVACCSGGLPAHKPAPQMPPAGPLPEPKIKLIQSWIDQGAEWPDELSGDRSSTPADATVERMRTALREGKPAEFRRLLKASPKSVNATGQDGWTPLMYAALYGNVESCQLLLDREPLSMRGTCWRDGADVRSR